jgi:signal transduction histidine kinase/CheY-like chemotaxis protein
VVSLQSLPFPAILLDAGAIISAANTEWAAAHPDAGPGTGVFKWCEIVHEEMPEFAEALSLGAQRVLQDGSRQFTHDYTTKAHRRRLTVAASIDGALVFHHDLGGLVEAPEDERKWQSQKMETVGRLAGGVAHDFANLLTLISGYSDILLNRIGERDPLRPELDEIRKAANRGARLTTQLLGFSRGQGVQPRVIDLNSVIVDLERMLRRIIGEYVEFTTSLGANLSKVLADRGQIEQVIMNLVLNARDAMPGGGRIKIETSDFEVNETEAQARSIAPGSYVRVSVSDTGHGIDASAQVRLFEPFFTTKEQGKGTGLGLSTVYGIVKQSGGAVWVRSAPGEGAEFTICLPRAATAAEHGDSGGGARPATAGSETVLLVEDDDNVRRLLMHVLRKRGYQVIEASGGEEALRIFDGRKDAIQLVLTDIVMPNMSGRELADRLLQIRPDLRVVYMSGYTDDVLVRTGALRPGMSFLQKPLRPEVLAAKIREALDSPVRPFNPR